MVQTRPYLFGEKTTFPYRNKILLLCLQNPQYWAFMSLYTSVRILVSFIFLFNFNVTSILFAWIVTWGLLF
jgi:hypothetical protein